MTASVAIVTAGLLFVQQNPEGLALPGTAKVADVATPLLPAKVELGGLIGERYFGSIYNRLMKVDEAELLGGFQNPPGSHPWIGEHVGKWLHAASLSAAGNSDPKLRIKLKRVASALMATQEPDGYLGTYSKDSRFGLTPGADWDVWVHKYNLIGLLTYAQVVPDPKALEACRKAADLLIRTFPAGGRSIVTAGTHQGMAATSVLEPIVLLYRATKDPRYLTFAKRIVDSYRDPGGPRIIDTLLAGGSVHKTANGKAYEMLSNLVGLCELYRVTGDRMYLKAPLLAWNDISAHHLYLTGTGSSFEHWTPDGQLPNTEGDHVGETCVTVSWLQLNMQLLRLTGEAKYGDAIERTVFNHLFAAQTPDGSAWSYYTPLNGRKHPGTGITCCLSSGPRGVALLPSAAFSTRKDGVDVNLYGPFVASLPFARLQQVGAYPYSGNIRLIVEQSSSSPWTLRLRIPAWATGATLKVNGRSLPQPKPGSYASIRKVWRSTDRVDLNLPVSLRIVQGKGSNSGSGALQAGPLVFSALHEGAPAVFAGKTLASLSPIRVEDNSLERVKFAVKAQRLDLPSGTWKSTTLRFVPFYVAGQKQTGYLTWLPLGVPVKPLPSNPSLFAYGRGEASRIGNRRGSLTDGDFTTYTVTFDSRKSEQDWFAVVTSKPIEIARVVFAHGASFHDGGWFDTSERKPIVQIRRTAETPWEEVARLDSYPTTNASTVPSIQAGQRFEARFPAVQAIAVRVLGKPAYGDKPAQAFSSCAELQAFGPTQ